MTNDEAWQADLGKVLHVKVIGMSRIDANKFLLRLEILEHGNILEIVQTVEADY